MKKILGLIVIAASLTACNNSTETTPAADTTVVTPVITPTPDTVNAPVVTPDTTVHAGDTSHK
jgi:hypothetical protein